MALWKNFIIATISVFTLTWLSVTADAGWLIDHERYHVSVHGRLACRECHGDIREKSRHPDPVDVNRSLAEFFQPDQCSACHEEIFDEISKGSHAGKATTLWQRFDVCIECHNPHYQALETDETAGAMLSAPAKEKCSQCHEYQARLPEFSDEDQQCLQCHLAVSGDNSRAVRQTADLCFHCHSTASRQAGSFPLIDATRYASSTHNDMSCLVCHPQAAAFRHAKQSPGDCRQCHRPHDEKVAHDLHAVVTCGACHLSGIEPVRDFDSGLIVSLSPSHPDRVSPIHQMQLPHKDDSCRSCHTGGNTIGAAALVLPAKSIICMPCHAATLSVGDTVTVLALVFFLAGLAVVGSVWLSIGSPSVGSRLKPLQSIRAIAVALFFKSWAHRP